MNSLKLWLTLRVHGRKAYEDLIDRQLALAGEFARWVQASEDFELAGAIARQQAGQNLGGVLGVKSGLTILSRLGEVLAAADHAGVVEEVTRDGQLWISETIVNGKSVIRMMVISYLTEQRHLQALEIALTKAASQLISRAKVG